MCFRLHSSDDDLDVILHGTSRQKKKLHNKRNTGNKSSSEDEFEKEMKAELNSTMKSIVVSNSKNVIVLHAQLFLRLLVNILCKFS